MTRVSLRGQCLRRDSGLPSSDPGPKPQSLPCLTSLSPGKWTVQFPAEYAAEEDFYIDKETTVRVPMINRLGVFLLSRNEELSSWVLVQHAVGDVMAFFILPDPGKMQELEEGLTQEHFNKILRTIGER